MTFTSCTKQPAVTRTLTLHDFLSDLTNVSALATAPLGTAHLETTYDRSGGNEDYARMDSLKKGDDLYEIANLQGPGCVKRLWMVSFKAQEWQFYFDGEKTPSLAFAGHGEECDLFGKQAPFLPPLCDHISGGNYCYMPIPFKKSLRIVVKWTGIKSDARPYYQINYDTYDNGISVESFPKVMSAADTSQLADVGKVWIHPGIEGKIPQMQDLRLPAGKSFTWVDEDSPGIITSFRIAITKNVATTVEARKRLLRDIVLRIYWNGMSQPSVDVPLGAFFCNGLSWRKFESLCVANVDDTFVCNFPMPYHKVRAELINQGDLDVSGSYCFDGEHWDGTGNKNYFHASWVGANGSGIPLRVVRAEGSGYLVGTYLDAIGTDGGWNILEGDDLMAINGESQPSFHGTGLEDYFNGAWYYSGLFDLPLHGLITKSPIRTSQYRFHVPDRISFTNGLYYSFEFGHANSAQGYLSSVAYWYQPEPHAVGNDAVAKTEKFPQADPLEPYMVMSGLFELERIGAYDEAREFCLGYLEKFPTAPWNAYLQLRTLAYQERVSGYDSVSNALAEFKAAQKDPEVVAEAEKLIWFHDAPTHALLGIHPMGRHRVYIDGQLVGEGDDPTKLLVFPVELNPGPHELTVELSPTKADGQMSVYLRTHTTNIVTDGSWEYVKVKPDGWPSGADANHPWKPVEQFFMLPSLRYSQFMPNGFIDMQSGATLVRPWPEWLEGRDVGYLKKRFIIPQ